MIKKIAFVAHPTHDMQRARHFYGEVLGLASSADYGDMWAEFETPDGKTITQICHGDDPVRGPMTWRSVTKIEDENTHLFEMYGTDKSGKEELMMEIVYTRKQQ